MRMRIWLAVLACLCFAYPAALGAQPSGGEQALLASRTMEVLAVMQRRQPASEVFNQRFLNEVPPKKLDDIVSQLEAQYGNLTGANVVGLAGPNTANVTLQFERAHAAAIIVLDPVLPRRVSGFRITSVGSASTVRKPGTARNPGSPAPRSIAPRSIAEEFAALPGSAGFTLARLDDSGPVSLDARLPNQLFAIGSTFKLWVLDAVAEEVASGRLSWQQVVRLGPRSLPSGVLQDWPQDAPVTVESLATLMISVSDNTATDTLIRQVGRERVEARVAASGHSQPSAMHPFLTTAEAFRLKLGPQAVRDGYARGDGNARLQMLGAMPAGIDASSTDFSSLASGRPVAIDCAEWFASPGDIVRILDALRRRSDPRVLAILGVSPGMSRDMRGQFAAVGYKGGSEPGVLNLSWLLRRPSGNWYVVTVSWNNPAAAVDTIRLELLAQRLIDQAR